MSPLLLLLACSSEFPASVTVEANPSDRLGALVEVGKADDPLSAWVEATVDGETLASTAVTLSPDAKTTLVVRGLLAGSTAELEVVATDGRRTWRSEPEPFPVAALPTDWPACQVTVDAGEHLGPHDVVCSNGVRSEDLAGVYYCVDRQGRPRWSLEHATGLTLRVVTGLPGGGHAAVGHDQSVLVVFDERGAETGWYTPSWFAGRTRFEHEWIDGHELILLEEGPWAGALALMTSTWDEVAPDAWRLAYGIIVFDLGTETVLWDWSAHGVLGDGLPIDPAIDYDRLGVSAVDSERFMHANAIVSRQRDDGGSELWLSMRHQDWIVAIDTDTDAVLWRLGLDGDFDLVDDLDAAAPASLSSADWFFAQHAPVVVEDDGDRVRLMLFDNGKRRPGVAEDDWYSRALELTLDTDTMQAAPGFSFGDPSGEDAFYAAGGGDVDPLPGGAQVQVLKGWNATAVMHASYPEGELLWRWECPELPDEQEQYRAAFKRSVYER